MKKLHFVILFLGIVGAIYANDNRIAVLDFNSENVPEPELKVISDRMRTCLVKYDFLKVMERGEIKDLLKEQSFQYQDYFSNEEAVKAGKMVGANYILAGSIQELESSYYVSARLIEVETTTTYAQQDVIAETKNFAAILNKIPTLAEKIVHQYSQKKDIAFQEGVLENTKIEPNDSLINKMGKEKIGSADAPTIDSGYKKGGIGPCLSSCLIGPRVGLEMNEGTDIHTSEWVFLGGNFLGAGLHWGIPVATRLYMAHEMGYKPNGMKGCLVSLILGPRIGNEIDTRRIREKEWMMLIPCVNIYPMISIPLEAYHGKTMTEIAKREGLRKQK